MRLTFSSLALSPAKLMSDSTTTQIKIRYILYRDYVVCVTVMRQWDITENVNNVDSVLVQCRIFDSDPALSQDFSSPVSLKQQ